jgi:hypothetical protein
MEVYTKAFMKEVLMRTDHVSAMLAVNDIGFKKLDRNCQSTYFKPNDFANVLHTKWIW